ncbi:inward rectifier potassium channel [Paraburkholderia bannensis]|uniref:Inward rectifier potassium channel n=1 Tax=Paraburkholderia bannensis TaxID=765414 RepID=A0A7W9TU60_9BURK|nr:MULTISPECIES: ion channel [Paraburkholderia]MBB3256124.1 inward rectifier potassium channel [Paraburkholderia sp. WP4_3_2]MBB6101124.1 inward rectifier potassium channel [Paraburkholderia bannensis]
MTAETPERDAREHTTAAQTPTPTTAQAEPHAEAATDSLTPPADCAPPKARRRGARAVRVGAREVTVYGMPVQTWTDFYHYALTMRWPTFFASLAGLFMVLNTAFACLYELGAAPIANQFPHGFMGAFFFSVETLATVGYGDMHPQTVYAHLVATFEIFVGMSGVALATGLVFARFSRPRAKIWFARQAVIHPLEGRMTLMVRAANARQNVIAEAFAKLRLIRIETSPEGYTARRIYDLKLVRSEHPLFTLGWNLMHVIDESSPLYGTDAETLARQSASLHVVIEGSDESTAQTMQARHIWVDADIRWQYRYVDLMTDIGGVSVMDYTHFHDVVAFEDTRPYGPQVI